jgi:hypothetical protein
VKIEIVIGDDLVEKAIDAIGAPPRPGASATQNLRLQHRGSDPDQN